MSGLEPLALIGAGLLLLGGLIFATAKLSAARERERIHRYLAEKAKQRSSDATKAHQRASRKGRKKYTR